MPANTQIIITSDLNGEIFNIHVVDLFTGTTLMTIRGNGVTNRKCLDMIHDQYLINAQKDTPIINIWSFGRQNQVHTKIVSSGKVNALRVTFDACYCVAGIEHRIFIWQLSSGNLMAILEKHYQAITCIETTSDSSHFVSAGMDGIAMVWCLAEMICSDDSNVYAVKEPRHKWTHHTGSINDVHIGFGGVQARCATCATDQTCRIYELLSGLLMITIVFDTPLCSVTMDPAEYFLFVGGEDGNIYETKLYEKPNSSTSQQVKSSAAFIGHSAGVTCLAVSIDGLALISGSNDNTVKIWHINSKQCMRTNKHKGPISNVLVCATPSGLCSQVPPSNLLPIRPFKRHLINESSDNDLSSAYEQGCINVKINSSVYEYLSHAKNQEPSLHVQSRTSNVNANDDDVEALKSENRKIKRVNEQLYNFAVDSIFKSTH